MVHPFLNNCVPLVTNEESRFVGCWHFHTIDSLFLASNLFKFMKLLDDFIFKLKRFQTASFTIRRFVLLEVKHWKVAFDLLHSKKRKWAKRTERNFALMHQFYGSSLLIIAKHMPQHRFYVLLKYVYSIISRTSDISISNLYHFKHYKLQVKKFPLVVRFLKQK